MTIDEHIANGHRVAEAKSLQLDLGRTRQAEAASVRSRQFENDLRECVDRIGRREHDVFKGRGVRWFSGDFVVSVHEWRREPWSSPGNSQTGGGSSGWTYSFRDYTTRHYENVEGWYFFPDWNLSIKAALHGDINDRQELLKYLSSSREGPITLRMFHRGENRKSIAAIFRSVGWSLKDTW